MVALFAMYISLLSSNVATSIGFEDSVCTEHLTVSATYSVVEMRALDGDNVLEKRRIGAYFRDGCGRSRKEESGFVIINDPVAARNYVLDPRQRIAQVWEVRAPVKSPKVASKSLEDMPPPALPSRTIEGYAVIGEEHVKTIPVTADLGNRKPIRIVTQRWVSPELGLTLLEVIQSPLAGTKTTTFSEIKVGLTVPPLLFAVPPEYSLKRAGGQDVTSGR
jgi:hypothetical protein